MSSDNPTSMLPDVLGSATAGIISRVVTHPLDTAKARLQASMPTGTQSKSLVVPFRGPLDALVRTYRYEGFRALYGGFGAVIVAGTPGTVVYLVGYSYFRDSIASKLLHGNRKCMDLESQSAIASSDADVDGTIFASKGKSENSLTTGQEFCIHLSAGMLAEVVACIIYVPVDVVKERMQVQQRVRQASNNNLSQSVSYNYQYKSSWDAIRKIIKTEGFHGIYKGYGATLMSFGPFSALYFVFYERCKAFCRVRIQQQNSGGDSNHAESAASTEDRDIPLLHLVACSAGSGALASFLTSPLDMAKLRLQVQRGNAAASTTGQHAIGTSVQYRSMLECLRAAFNEGGIRGLFRGAGARVLHFAPATTITMTCYEKCKSFYADSLG